MSKGNMVVGHSVNIHNSKAVCREFTLQQEQTGISYISSMSYHAADLDELELIANCILHPAEQLIYNDFTYPARRLSYLIGRYCAKSALTYLTPQLQHIDIHIKNGFFEFPYVANDVCATHDISISHSGNVGVALAFDKSCPMGVDLEHVNQDKTEVILSQLTDGETSLLAELDLDIATAATLMWTFKESLAKTIKCGFLVDLQVLEICDVSKVDSRYQANFKYFPVYIASGLVCEQKCNAFVYPKYMKLILGHDFTNIFDN